MQIIGSMRRLGWIRYKDFASSILRKSELVGQLCSELCMADWSDD